MTKFRDSEDSGSELLEFRGPANWFSLRHPRSLSLVQRESFVEIRPAPGKEPPDWSLILYAAWIDSDEPDSRSPAFPVSSLFPRVVHFRREDPLSTSVRCRAWSGLSRRALPTGSWWSRLRRHPYEWRLWILEHEQVTLVASLQSVPARPLSLEGRRQCEAILGSIQFAESPAMPPDIFRQEVIALAKKHFPLLEAKAARRFSIELQGSEINLSNFYRSYLRSPQIFKRIVLPGLTSVVRLQEWGPDQVMPDLELIQSHIMPMLHPSDDAANSLQGFVQLPWIAGLTKVFVIDEDDTYRFVHSGMLQQWQLSVEGLQDLAMGNLDDYTDEHPLHVNVVGDDDDPQMLVPVNLDPWNSARILGQRFHDRLRELFGPEVVVGLPNRDFFVAVSLRHPELISQVRQRVIQDFQSMHHPLTQRLLLISADGVSEFCEADSD